MPFVGIVLCFLIPPSFFMLLFPSIMSIDGDATIAVFFSVFSRFFLSHYGLDFFGQLMRKFNQ